MRFALVGQSGRDSDNPLGNTSRLVNIYAEKMTTGERALKSVLGMDPHVQLNGVLIRAMGVVDGVTYAILGGRLWRIRENGSASPLGQVTTGHASLSGNNGAVCIQAGTRYFVYDSGMSEPATGAFSAFGSVEYIDNYTVLTEAGGRMFQWSDLADPKTLPGLNFSTADANDDKLVRAFALDGRLYLFKEHSTEIWYNTGASGAEAFQRVAGGVKGTGLKAHNLICRFDDGAFMVGSDNRASLIAGGQFQPISTPAVETAIRESLPVACLVYSDEGHTFLCIVLRDAPAWCYDLAMGEWHERAEGEAGPWNVAASARLGDEWAIGRDSGEIAVLRRTNSDGGRPLIRELTTPTLRMDGARTVLREFEVFPSSGFRNGSISLRLSRDGGATWTPDKTRILTRGEFDDRAIWRNLGMGRALTAKLRWSDPYDLCLSENARIAT
ncbi:hypothetical protein GL279_00410 [Paracoccus limosus]|uniref:Uncharacterized protein n=1 Tax=Paracoccus limosus TaxID=913252 RepID=A0A844H0U3_9RHOB|nr:hypothetical protein [Paracoccus limosus]MTH33060.1 hypothetical protein [Paracoccus limosus]